MIMSRNGVMCVLFSVDESGFAGWFADVREQVYNMFHRQYMHKMLLDCATQEEGEGHPVKVVVNHKVCWPPRVVGSV